MMDSHGIQIHTSHCYILYLCRHICSQWPGRETVAQHSIRALIKDMLDASFNSLYITKLQKEKMQPMSHKKDKKCNEWKSVYFIYIQCTLHYYGVGPHILLSKQPRFFMVLIWQAVGNTSLGFWSMLTWLCYTISVDFFRCIFILQILYSTTSKRRTLNSLS